VTGSFFEVPAAEPEPEYQPRGWMGPPGDVLTDVIGVGQVIGRSDRAVVVLTDLRPFPTGVMLRVLVWIRIEGDDDYVDVPSGLLHHRPGDQRAFRLGFELADGRRATNLARPRWTDEDPGPVLLTRGGGAGGPHGQAEAELWLWPLPPPGRLRVVCEWPAYGIAETSLELDATELVDAAARARPVWDL
jgi:hypothetical protein